MADKKSKKTTEANQNNPFDEDTNRFKRLIPFSENLTKFITNQGKTKSLVISLDAPWGYGKTTFLNMWYTLLKDLPDKNVVKFDAWGADYSDSPFTALISTLDKEFNENNKGLSKKLIESGKAIVKNAIPALTKFTLDTIARYLKINETGEKLIDNLLETEEKFIDEAIKDHQNKLNTVIDFKNSLEKFSNRKQVVILIDELDRCKPTFSIELLEVIKHFFDVKNCCFVIAMNHEQMAKTVKKRYGNEFDGTGYLERFFDKMIPLPEPEHDIFVEIELDSNQFMNTLLNKHLRNGKTRDLLQSFIKKSIIHYELNLREIQKYISDLSDFFSIANQPLFELYFPVIAVLIVAKRKNRNTDDFLEALNDQVEKTYFLEAMDLFKSTDKDSFIKVYHRILEKTAKYNGLESYRLINREVKEREIFTHIINYIGDIVNINYKDLATEFNSITGFILTNEVLQGNKVPATNQLGE